MNRAGYYHQQVLNHTEFSSYNSKGKKLEMLRPTIIIITTAAHTNTNTVSDREQKQIDHIHTLAKRLYKNTFTPADPIALNKQRNHSVKPSNE